MGSTQEQSVPYPVRKASRFCAFLVVGTQGLTPVISIAEFLLSPSNGYKEVSVRKMPLPCLSALVVCPSPASPLRIAGWLHTTV